VKELRTAGHQVLGLVRSDAAADRLAGLGVEAHRGDLSETDSLVAGARACDGVIHTAYIHDWSNATFEAAAEIDRRTVEAMAAAMEGSGKSFVIASGTALLPPGRIGTEEDPAVTEGLGAHRGRTEASMQAAAGRGVRAGVVRLPPSVHGAGDHGFLPALIDIARRKGISASPATARIAGRPCTGWTPRASFGWRSRTALPERACMPSPKKA